jgi:hypothetical protein
VAHAHQEGLGWAHAKLRLILLPCVTFFLESMEVNFAENNVFCLQIRRN